MINLNRNPSYKVNCPYCGHEAMLHTGIYRDSMDITASGAIWLCRGCDAYTGCRADSSLSPVGMLANPFLRCLREQTARTFDQVWRGGGMSRPHAYQVMAERMGLHLDEAKVEKFNEPQCMRLLHMLFSEHGTGRVSFLPPGDKTVAQVIQEKRARRQAAKIKALAGRPSTWVAAGDPID